MSMNIAEPTPRELAFATQLRELAVRQIDRRDISVDEIAERLQMLPLGVEMLLNRGSWSVEVGIRVTEALGVDVRLEAAEAA